jgi:hypothetical protein
MRAENIPDNEPMPQITPIWTRDNPKSSEISWNSTGIHIEGMAMIKVSVKAPRVSTTHL